MWLLQDFIFEASFIYARQLGVTDWSELKFADTTETGIDIPTS